MRHPLEESRLPFDVCVVTVVTAMLSSVARSLCSLDSRPLKRLTGGNPLEQRRVTIYRLRGGIPVRDYDVRGNRHIAD